MRQSTWASRGGGVEPLLPAAARLRLGSSPGPDSFSRGPSAEPSSVGLCPALPLGGLLRADVRPGRVAGPHGGRDHPHTRSKEACAVCMFAWLPDLVELSLRKCVRAPVLHLHCLDPVQLKHFKYVSGGGNRPYSGLCSFKADVLFFSFQDNDFSRRNMYQQDLPNYLQAWYVLFLNSLFFSLSKRDRCSWVRSLGGRAASLRFSLTRHGSIHVEETFQTADDHSQGRGGRKARFLQDQHEKCRGGALPSK